MKPWDGFIISLLLGVTGIFVIIRLTGSINLSRLNFFWFLGSIRIVIVWWIAESMSLKTILSAVNLKLGLFQILKIMLSSFFFGAITPFNSGFLPAELVLLKGANIDLELSFPVVMVKMILNGLLRGLLAIALGIYLRGSLGFLAGRIVFIVLTIYGFVSILGYFILFSKNRYSNFLRALICKFFDSLGNKFNFIGRISIHISNSLKNGPQTIEPLLKNTSWLSKTLSWSLLF